MIRYRDIIIQIVYVIFGCVAIWSMIDSPFYSSNNRANGYLVTNVIVTVLSLFMFVSGFVTLAKNVYSQTTSEYSLSLRLFMIMRMALAVLFGMGTQWFFVQAVLESVN